ncbi:MAG: pilus assembly protein CpaE [Burkholderiaceae bacterium]|nr:pilus assembly protein CpaE [Burkholderiaceae bacterium]
MNETLSEQLRVALEPVGLLRREYPVGEQLSDLVAACSPDMIFLDYLSLPGHGVAQACEHAKQLKRLFPHIPLLAIGKQNQPGSAVAAFRAGVGDFADADMVDDLLAAVQRLLRLATERPHKPVTHCDVVLLGARTGVGTSTLAVHLAHLLQQRLLESADEAVPESRGPALDHRSLADTVCLLDLGMPVGDGLLYLGMNSDFHFVDAVQNLARMDGTLLNTALAHNEMGMCALALPRTLSLMRNASHTDSLALVERLQSYFGVVVTDAGGLSYPPFISGLANAAQHLWVVTDQSVGALVSLADLLDELEQQEVDKSTIGLVVNRYNPRYGMEAAEIAERFELRLHGTLPDRSLVLMQAMNKGKLLFDEAPRDAYLKALNVLIRQLPCAAKSDSSRGSWLSNKLPGLRRSVAG